MACTVRDLVQTLVQPKNSYPHRWMLGSNGVWPSKGEIGKQDTDFNARKASILTIDRHS